MNAKDHFDVPLDPVDRDKEVYRASDENIMKVDFQPLSGEMSAPVAGRVIISLTRDAMLGLGCSLIRAAHKVREGEGAWEFERLGPGSATEQLGVYLHPSSCEVVLILTPLGKVSDHLNEK